MIETENIHKKNENTTCHFFQHLLSENNTENALSTTENREILNKTLYSVSNQTNAFIAGSEDKIIEVLKELNNLSLVTQKEISILEQAQAFLVSVYTDVPSHRTYIDKCVGVLTNSRFPTPDAKYWQCKKEAEVQFYELIKELCLYRKLTIDIKELIYKREKIKENIEKNKTICDQNFDEFLAHCEIEKINVALMELNLLLKKSEKEIKYRIAEIGDWLMIASEWEPQMKHSKDIYSAHQIESLYAWLHYQIQEAQMNKDKEKESMLMDQLSTLKSLLKRKLEEIGKKFKEENTEKDKEEEQQHK